MARGLKTGRRGVSPLSLAFLDVMFCGFGAVILIFLILDHTSTVSTVESSPDLDIELNMLQREIEEGVEGNQELRNLLADLTEEYERGEVESEQLREQVELLLRELELLNNSGADSDLLRDRLLSDIESLETQIEELQAQEFERAGNNVRQFLGDGNRQYLSGMFLGGQRVLILMDASASMLDETLVNIFRTRNMPDERKVLAPKWQRVLQSVDWITTQIPVTSRYQLWSFNTEVTPALPGDPQVWLEVADRDQLEEAVSNLRATIPTDGTNLEQVFRIAANMSPPPDNIFLITDGLPTVDEPGPASGWVTSRDRRRLFETAVGELPRGIPVNIILMPLESDPSAAFDYWRLAIGTSGSLLAPSRDWPQARNASSSSESDDEEEEFAPFDPTEQVSRGNEARFPADF
ncbi:MAG: VWA domain-containing protein [Gammaproteobacteria bacterium]|nr:VWA domain-containing protein [Gammaproteobacteria bacterium]MYE29089.1 VWA domain-containing protein [Gammaproteobacteria bacterium]